MKNFCNQNYNTLKSTCSKTSTLFEDPHFSPTNDSLCYSKQPAHSVVWKRPKEITRDARLFVDGTGGADVTQGQVGAQDTLCKNSTGSDRKKSELSPGIDHNLMYIK